MADATQPWWRGAAIYQIYPRSFADSNGDGVGDLPGITERLDYVAGLGVDAVWLSPFFKSPMRDFGYDVADYCDVDAIFGTIADFRALVDRAHALGLRLLIDQVYSHSSDQHPWFKDSRLSRDAERADWYVWADAKEDGSPPNNWQSVFGGPAWTWDARRGQYYLHNFLPEQPDLNLHNPQVQDAILSVARFWFDQGVDGFRLDAINFTMHDPQLRDNPPAPSGGKRTRPFDFQQHIYNQSHPAIPSFIERLRALADSYGDRFLLAEVGGANALTEMQEYTAGSGRLHSAYSFDFLYADELTPELVAQASQSWPQDDEVGWPSWAFENHDAPRALSRWVGPEHRERFARLKMLLLACLRGSIIIYQGEELGLTQVDVPFDQLRDPEAIRNWPLTLARDGARTPVPWDSQAANLGFTQGKPWLPVGPDHAPLSVDLQARDGTSLLSFTRQVIAMRNSLSALRTGALRIKRADNILLSFERSDGRTTYDCCFNISDQAVEWSADGKVLIATGSAERGLLGPFSAAVVERTS
ncbi:alpha-glucosidase [Sphingomonas piscis]|uniref:Alpha-glucosidase n=1 Tax=Sphingomonas piscis TaxID=2714943 RepID=A0A6G7YT90_9SPHN|nr:alpha-amylase family glycosyl hydrolase [Sphingomonas piscis]QIK79957.1 alpha-glucosidase [Sphingomonas piscis]